MTTQVMKAIGALLMKIIFTLGYIRRLSFAELLQVDHQLFDWYSRHHSCK